MGNIVFTANDDGTTDAVGKQGATWYFTLSVKDEDDVAIDLTGYTARGQIRRKYTSEDFIEEFTCALAVDPTTGIINVLLSDSETDLIAKGKYVYDIEMESSTGYVTRLIQGKLSVDPQVTK